VSVVSTYKALLLGLAALVLNNIIYLLLGYETDTLLTQILVLGVAIAVTVSWLPAAIQAFTRGAIRAADKITISVWTVWAIVTVQRFYALTLNVLDRPDWLVYSPIASNIVTAIIVAGAYAAYATVGEADAPKQERGWVLFATFCGGLVAGALGVFAYTTHMGPF
jgi:hypothetical protein